MIQIKTFLGAVKFIIKSGASFKDVLNIIKEFLQFTQNDEGGVDQNQSFLTKMTINVSEIKSETVMIYRKAKPEFAKGRFTFIP